ncbi:MAG: hypothetical protein A2430_00335 [Candidatus Liptonbacteria bacterium RIFOXYC1_FULL_36_8]|uniref:Uncharacterized protein n=3 Tax=Candidatus Liptoniibacteriota TaxID=1817909 RepID=A0A1G2CP58_9BACT|nr:MAG: hypothetical protein A2604_01100 [Candidatus Liptonbacteria bacterium RIFOXYD1_FULL_36_11]OGZ03077.1 MAG: hypothetical protein A2430_00335 [Candidatus Liptonbacteria bacterium RIFOXYC1_FULL_36_8]OGZ03196.1 MAG: hypothetical protein A2390_00585 [Candidatus Liptonbacteria bacterium RIFOXYB1_FULL_36_10]
MLTGIVIVVIAILLVGCILFFIIRECEKIEREDKKAKDGGEDIGLLLWGIIEKEDGGRWDMGGKKMIDRKVQYRSRRSGKTLTAKIVHCESFGSLLKLKRPRYKGYFWRKATEVTFL